MPRSPSRQEIQTDTVLVIDDDEADRHIIARALRKARPGLEIVEATNAADGIVRMEAVRPAFVLLDLRMAGVDGFSVLARTKADGATAPVVVLSTSSNPDDVRKAYRLHASAYVMKPSTMADYEALARRLVDFWIETVVRP